MTKEELKSRLLDTNCFYDNEYLLEYIDLIIENLSNKSKDIYCEKHHIIPRNVFNLLNIKIDNSEENICLLSYIDHIKAHALLSLASSNYIIKLGNANAFCFMTGENNVYKVKDDNFINEVALLKENYNIRLNNFENIKKWREEHPKEFAKSQSRPGEINGMFGYAWDEEHRKKQAETFRKYYETHPNCATWPEVKKKISNSLMGHEVTEESRIKVSNFVKGSTSITNGRNNLRCDKSNISYYEQLGYYKGTTKNLSKDIEKITITNRVINHRIPIEDFSDWEKLGWIKGSAHKLKNREKEC